MPALPGPRYKHSKGSSRPKTPWRQHRWDLFPTRAKDAPPNLIYSIKTACRATLPNTKSRPFLIINFLNLFRALSNSLILLQMDTEQWMGLDPHNTKAAIIFFLSGRSPKPTENYLVKNADGMAQSQLRGGCESSCRFSLASTQI